MSAGHVPTRGGSRLDRGGHVPSSRGRRVKAKAEAEALGWLAGLSPYTRERLARTFETGRPEP